MDLHLRKSRILETLANNRHELFYGLSNIAKRQNGITPKRKYIKETAQPNFSKFQSFSRNLKPKRKITPNNSYQGPILQCVDETPENSPKALQCFDYSYPDSSAMSDNFGSVNISKDFIFGNDSASNKFPQSAVQVIKNKNHRLDKTMDKNSKMKTNQLTKTSAKGGPPGTSHVSTSNPTPTGCLSGQKKSKTQKKRRAIKWKNKSDDNAEKSSGILDFVPESTSTPADIDRTFVCSPATSKVAHVRSKQRKKIKLIDVFTQTTPFICTCNAKSSHVFESLVVDASSSRVDSESIYNLFQTPRKKKRKPSSPVREVSARCRRTYVRRRVNESNNFDQLVKGSEIDYQEIDDTQLCIENDAWLPAPPSDDLRDYRSEFIEQ